MVNESVKKMNLTLGQDHWGNKT